MGANEARIVDFLQMVVLQLEKLRKDGHGVGRSRTVEAVANRCVETRTGVFLDFFEDGEQATQSVPRIHIFGVECHCDLFLLGCMGTLEAVQAGFEYSGAHSRDLLLSPRSSDSLLQQCRWVGRAVEHCSRDAAR